MIPNVNDLASDRLQQRFGDLFSPPALTNFMGCVQVDIDPVAIRSLSFPPYSTSDVATGGLFLNGTYFLATGAPVTFQWFPDRVEREATWDGWHIRTTTAMPQGQMGVLVRIEVTNEGPSRDLELRLGLRGGITKNEHPWREPSMPVGSANDVRPSSNAVAFVETSSGATWVQGGWPQVATAEPGALVWRTHVSAGEHFEARFATVIGQSEDQARAATTDLLERTPAHLRAIHDDWNAELSAVFTHGNDRFGGSLPLLETSDDDLRKIYNLGALGVVYFKRESPFSVVGRTYDTLMPKYWQTTTFLWDYSLSAQVHALLDPAVMRRNLELWMASDMHTCFGTEWLTGGPVGGWYSVNDYAMTRMIHEYLRWSGDRAWLDTTPDGTAMTVREHMRRHATNWERFRTPNGLADYGGIGNLLECVSTYIHEVASMNAGNVFGLRAAAEVAALDGDAQASAALTAQAAELVSAVKALYAEGQGYWNARFPDGSLMPVKHCYDFSTVLATIADDLSAQQRDEMADFCLREFVTPTWMRALSASDPDAFFSVRPDHQWNGAYPAWPPQAVAGLYRAGHADDAFRWLKGLARSANQGPYGQAHFTETAVEPIAGGARKAPQDLPYINDWTCSSNGAWVQMVIESIFGVRANLDGSIRADSNFSSLDPDARLRGLVHQGTRYDVDRSGITRS